MEKDDLLEKAEESVPIASKSQSSDETQEKSSGISVNHSAIIKLGGYGKVNKLLGDEDPKPGPSNSASDFDLEVFDSGSSCSNEECWVDASIIQKKLSQDSELDKEVNLYSLKMEDSQSETEVASVQTKQNRETQTGSDLIVPKSSSSKDSDDNELPRETLNRRESVELWKSKNVTQTIVEDHDVYGTDENEDSLDSLVHNEDSMDSLALSSRRTSVCGDQSEVILVDQNLSRCCSRASNPESVTVEAPEPEDGHQPICDLYTQTCSSGTGLSYEVKTSQTESEYFQPIPSTSKGIEVESDQQKSHKPTQTEAENFRPKRKSGSFSELSLSCLPLKRQKPEVSSPPSSRSIFMVLKREASGETALQGDTTPLGMSSASAGLADDTPVADSSLQDELDESNENQRKSGFSNLLLTEDNSYLSLFDNTAPTSPASPASPEDADGIDASSPTQRSPSKPSPRALFSPGVARNLIPDRENPPPEILGWVATFSRWSNAERLMAINQLIHTCEPQQVRHMMQVIEPQFQRDFISLLPKELALYVLSFLQPRDLLRAAQTCRYWRVLAEDNLLWREKCREAGLQDCKENYRRRKYTSGFVYSPWKTGFMRQHNIEMNWRVKPVKPPKVLKGHDDHVITCLQFSGNKIVSGSDDNTLKVWSAVTGKCLRTLVGHTGGVWSSQMQGNVIVSGSTDRTLKVWNGETGSCVHTLYGHTSTVRCMHLHGTKVVSGSRDATLRMWDIETGECNMVLVGHVAAVRCVQYDGRLVVSGAYDYMVKVWNPEREECIHTLSGHTNRVYSLQFDGTHVVSGSLDTSIRVWDVETGACKHTLMGHQSLTSGMELKENILVSGNADSTVKIWDIISGQCLQTLSGPNKHQSAVTCLHFNKKFVVTSSDDGTVKLWDVKTGDYIRDLVSLESGGSGGVVWRIRSSPTRLVCAVGSRNGTEETKLLVLDFDAEVK